MKAIIIGASLSGKTTIVKYLRKITNIPISEMDEQLTQMNDGKYPANSNCKNNILLPKIIENILSKKEIIFFTNTDYFSVKNLQKAKNKGFKIIQINVDYETLLIRNQHRVKNEGYHDLSMWLKGMIKYQENIRNNKLVDEFIDGKQTIHEIVKQLKNILKI